MSVTKEMADSLRAEAKKRKLGSVQEAMRAVLSEHFMLEEKAKEKPEPRRTIKLETKNPLAH